MARQEPQHQIVGLMTYRVVVITTLLISTFIIELIFHPTVPLRPFYLLGGVTYLLSLVYALVHRAHEGEPPLRPPPAHRGPARGHGAGLRHGGAREPLLLPLPHPDHHGVHPPVPKGRHAHRLGSVGAVRRPGGGHLLRDSPPLSPRGLRRGRPLGAADPLPSLLPPVLVPDRGLSHFPRVGDAAEGRGEAGGPGERPGGAAGVQRGHHRQHEQRAHHHGPHGAHHLHQPRGLPDHRPSGRGALRAAR